VEKAHPEIAYQNAIASMIEKYTQLKAATGSIIARRQEITARLETHERELASQPPTWKPHWPPTRTTWPWC
jgi:phage shock protein A